MKAVVKIKKWQLLRVKRDEEELDLTGEEFLTVGKRAFRGGTQVSVTLPSGVSAIKAEAFMGCKQLHRIVLSDENYIGLSYAVFRGCECLKAVENAGKISSIGEKCFAGCGVLEDIHLDKSLRRIGVEAFRGCGRLREIALPYSVETFGKGAFRDCKGLERVELDARIKTLAADLFRGCASLKEIALPTVLSVIPSGAFRDCHSISALRVPASVRTIGKHAFDGCSGLESVTMDLGVERIGAHAFANTSALREVYVPHTLKRLGFGAFGLGKREDGDKITIYVSNEYMKKRMMRLLSFCGSANCTEVVVIGKSLAERKRERHRLSLHSDPVHLIEPLTEKSDAASIDSTEDTGRDER